MGGWLWDSASNSCCTIKTTSNQPVFRKGGSSASVVVKNESDNSNKNCCTNSNTKGGHTRFNWTDSTNVSGSKGYCWLNDSELCTDQTNGMGGWFWDSSASRCCTIKYDTSITTAPKSQTVYRKGASSATVTIYNQQNASNKACCTNSNTKGGHTRFNWTDNNYASSGGYCWNDDSELCQTQTDASSTYGKDYGMGGWAWDSSANTCCTIKTTSAQTKYTKGGSSASVNVKNQQASSSKFCCTNSNTKGGHTRFNWIDNNYASKGGYCWLNDDELCQDQTDSSNDHGMGGWLWDSTNNVCCTVKTTSAQTKYTKGGSSASVNVKNQSSSSNKTCCTSTQTKGGHTRFNWTDNNYAGKGGYCWLDDEELCQSQTGLADYGMGGWLWDSTNNVCCTVKTTSAQTKYVKGGSSASVNVKNQSNDSTRQCCTSTQTKGGHTNTFWSSTTSKDNAGYCWNSKADFCKSTLAAGLKGWDYDSTNNQCCTNDTTTTSSYWNDYYYSAMTKKDQGSYSTEYCCTSTSTSNGHTNFNWINGKCWNSNSGFCTDTIANKGANGWYQDGSNCCTNSKTGTETVKGKGGTTSTITYKNNSDNSTAECCRKRGSNTRAYWLNSYCWSTLDQYCKSTNSSGAKGYYSYTSSGTNYCCTNDKSGSLSGKNDGSSYSVTYKGNSAGAQTTKECCVNATSGAKTYINNRCWNNLNGYCTTSSSSGGAGGYYQYGSNCCVASGTESSVTTYGGSSASSSSTLYIKNENSTKTCCHNKTGTTWYSTSSETGGTCCTSDNGSKACCESSQNGHTAGTWSESAKTCCFDADVSEACCKAIKGSDAYMAGGKCCASKDQSASCCQGFCGDAYSYKNNSCTCVTCEDGEYIPEDSSGNVLAAKCCTSKNDDETCCTAANAPGNTSGNYFYATTMCCASGNTSAECCAKYASNSGKSRFGYYDSHCTLLDSNQIYVCATFNTSKYSSVEVGTAKTSLDTGECTEVTYDNRIAITSKGKEGTHYSSCGVAGVGCSIDHATDNSSSADVSVGNAELVWDSNNSAKNYTCTVSPAVSDCSGWYESSSSNNCCTADSTNACCTSNLNPSGSGTWVTSGSVCCYDATVSDVCCKAMNNANYYLEGSTCCASGNSSSACCTSSSNPKGAGKKYISSGSVCCYSESDSDACCKAINTSSYFLAGSTCCASETTSDACCKGMNNDSYWLTNGGSCVNADNSKDACESDNNPDGKGVWVASANVCCYNENVSQTCCSAISPSKFWVNNACGACLDDSNKTNCESEDNCIFKNSGGRGLWIAKGTKGTGTYTASSDTCCHSQGASETCCYALCPSGSDCKWENDACTVIGCSNLTIATSPSADAVTVSTSGDCYKKNETVSVTATAKSGYTFTGWTVSGDCKVSSATNATTTITMGSSACTVTANAAKDEIPDVYGTCETCSQYMGASGCQSKDFYTTTTGGGVTCTSNQTKVSITSNNKQCCLVHTTTMALCVGGQYCKNEIGNTGSGNNSAFACEAVAPSSSAGVFVYNSPTDGSCYPHGSNMSKCFPNAEPAPLPSTYFSSVTASCSGGSAYYLNSSRFDTSSSINCADAPSTTTSYTADCTSNKYGTIVEIKAGTGVQSVSYSGKKRLWLGGTANISATMKSGYTFGSWDVSGSGCSAVSSSTNSTQAIGKGCSTSGGCTCSLTANAIDASKISFSLAALLNERFSSANVKQGSTTISAGSSGILSTSGTITATLTCSSATYTPDIVVSGTGCTGGLIQTDLGTATRTITATGGSSCSISWKCSKNFNQNDNCFDAPASGSSGNRKDLMVDKIC